jgi:hypothetical protein
MKSIKCECGNRFKPHTWLNEEEKTYCFSCRCHMEVINAVAVAFSLKSTRSWKSREYWSKKLEQLIKTDLPFSDLDDILDA